MYVVYIKSLLKKARTYIFLYDMGVKMEMQNNVMDKDEP